MRNTKSFAGKAKSDSRNTKRVARNSPSNIRKAPSLAHNTKSLAGKANSDFRNTKRVAGNSPSNKPKAKSGMDGDFHLQRQVCCRSGFDRTLACSDQTASDSNFKTARYSGRKAAGGSNPKSAIDSDAITLVKNDGFWKWRISALSERARGGICNLAPMVSSIANVPLNTHSQTL
ncbi:hypothetical protein HC024_10145 [Methylococcaceae bacterium WWC4]|nr:hypothetical protein [Methylococcaceae bacterium WWC4]